MNGASGLSSGANVAVVIGANRGVGRSTALALARRGVDVIITFRSNRAEARDVTKTIGRLGRKAIALRLDISARETFGAFTLKVRQLLHDHWDAERFSFLVNNTGHIAAGATSDLTEANFDERADVHLQGVFFLTQHLRTLIRDGGRIVNLSTGLAHLTASGTVASTPVKGVIETLAGHMAQELGPRGHVAGTTGADAGDSPACSSTEIPRPDAAIAMLGRKGQLDDTGEMIAELLLSDADQWTNAQRIRIPGA